jgi:hypothetical protein
MTEDSKISQRYRDLGREEPPRALDDAILAASRRAAATRPAPLVVPTGRQRWYFPLAAAAIIVLAVAVTMHAEREQPGEEIVAVQPAAPSEQARAEAAKPAQEPQRARKAPSPTQEFVPEPKPAPGAEQRVLGDAGPAAPPVDAASAARESARADAARTEAGSAQARAEAPAIASPQAAPTLAPPQRRALEAPREEAALSSLAKASPEQWLQGIDDLKRQGRHEEAEKQLAEFRKRYPNYRIPEALTEKFEKR